LQRSQGQTIRWHDLARILQQVRLSATTRVNTPSMRSYGRSRRSVKRTALGTTCAKARQFTFSASFYMSMLALVKKTTYQSEREWRIRLRSISEILPLQCKSLRADSGVFFLRKHASSDVNVQFRRAGERASSRTPRYPLRNPRLLRSSSTQRRKPGSLQFQPLGDCLTAMDFGTPR